MTTIHWFRRDLRLLDNPSLVAAAAGEKVVPVFIFDDRLLHGRHGSGPRTSFMLECLSELKDDLHRLGADLVVRHGRPEDVLLELVQETGASELHFQADVSPYARKRDTRVTDQLEAAGINVVAHPGLLAIDDPAALVTASSERPYSVFTPFFKAWQALDHRDVLEAPASLNLPDGVEPGDLPSLTGLNHENPTRPLVTGGESRAHEVMHAFYDKDVARYGTGQDDMGADTTSRLSAYLHFGALSPRQVEEAAPGHGAGADAFVRQIAWRDFYQYVLLHFPDNVKHEFQEKYRGVPWVKSRERLEAWQQGKTGYPLVDAGMRQLMAEGWMHNRARLVVGSFLTKDLGLDWREGERWFMKWLIDGDEASNNGNWQWIASVGTDPAPLYRRLYNPILHHERYDPDSTYVRRYVPELKDVPDTYIHEPWKMPDNIQHESGCLIGKDYPEPIVDHKQARLEAMDRYRVDERA